MFPSLTVNTDSPAGNACVLEVRSEGDLPEVHFTPSPAGGPEAMWFRFQVRAEGKPSRQIRCVLQLVDNLVGNTNAREGFHPVYKTAEGDWQRIETVTGIDLPDGRVAVSWLVPGDAGAVDVALCYPYGMAELDALLADTRGAFRSDVVGVTLHNRVLPRLSNGPGEPESDRPGIYCLARQHAGETPGSWMLDGFLRAMANAGDAAPLVWAAPFVNLDGVIAGEYGKDSFPCDFNRAWGSKCFPKAMWPDTGTHPMRHEVRCLQNDMQRWQKRCKPLLVLDFHAPIMCDSTGVFVFLRYLNEAGEPDPEHRPWIDAFRTALGEGIAAENFVRSGRYPSRWSTARLGDFAIDALGISQITFEVPYAIGPAGLFTREVYQQAGHRVAQAILTRLTPSDTTASAPNH